MPLKPACRATHPQILSGVCPWCCLPVSEQESCPEGERRQWDIARMEADLERDDFDVRSVTVSNLMSHGPGIEAALPLLGKAMRDPSGRISRLACHALTKLGSELSPEQVEHFDGLSSADPTDSSLHILLLGAYSLKRFQSEPVRHAREFHVLALIRDFPTSPVVGTPHAGLDALREGEAYREAKRLWLKHVEEQPTDARILGNAAIFFTIHDRTVAGEFFRKAKALEPENLMWSRRLAHLYSLESIGCPPEARTDWAAMSLAELESAARTTDRAGRATLLIDLAKSAFRAGERSKARSFAEELLSEATSAGEGGDPDRIHHGHIILGRLALMDGDRDAAKAHLLASVGPKGSPVLSSFGPRMSLAGELLERGEKDAVLRYLRLCSVIWTMGAEQLNEWTATIEQGRSPDFMAHLID
jgi:hypothetical protein